MELDKTVEIGFSKFFQNISYNISMLWKMYKLVQFFVDFINFEMQWMANLLQRPSLLSIQPLPCPIQTLSADFLYALYSRQGLEITKSQYLSYVPSGLIFLNTVYIRRDLTCTLGTTNGLMNNG